MTVDYFANLVFRKSEKILALPGGCACILPGLGDFGDGLFKT